MKLNIKKILILLFLLSLTSLASCKDLKDSDDNVDVIDPTDSDGDTNKGEIIESSDESNPYKTELDVYNALFDINNHVEIHIDIAASELEKIEEDYQKYSKMSSKSPIYRMCNLEVLINNIRYKIEEVGIRMKGNTSRMSFYSQADGITDLIHYKLSFGETFDEEEYYDTPKVYDSKEERSKRKDRTFATLGKLDLKWNRTPDATYVREIYAYDLFRENGLLAPHSTLSKITINNLGEKQSLGVYQLLEPIDKNFIKKYLPEDAKGDLYKIGWGSTPTGHKGGTLCMDTISAIGVEDEDKSYFPIYDLKTNKKTSTHDAMNSLIRELDQGNYDTCVDMDYFLKFAAVSYLVGNPDDYRTHYNNYYIYFADNKYARFIPFDFDRILGATNGWNPSNNAMSEIDPLSIFTTELGDCENPLVRNVIAKPGINQTKYLNYLKEIANSEFFSMNTFKNYYYKAEHLYSKDVIPSIKSISNDYTSFKLYETGTKSSWNDNFSINSFFNNIKKTLNCLN